MSNADTPLLPVYGSAKLTTESSSPPSRPRTPATASAGTQRSKSESAKYALLTPAQTATQLSTSLTQGLSLTEAESRRRDHGPNELPHEEPEPLWLRFIKQFKETLILLLLGSAAVSFIMSDLESAFSITIAVVIVVTVGFVQEYRSEKSLEALNSLVPNFAHVLRTERGGQIQPPKTLTKENGDTEMAVIDARSTLEEAEAHSKTIPAAELVPGDLVLFRTGDRIPADIRITQAVDLSIDESNLTGENEAVSKSPDRISHLPDRQVSFYASPATGVVGADVRLNDQHNIAFMGTLVRSGFGQGIVIGTGGKTEFGAISASLGEIESPRTPLQLSMDKLGKDLSYMSFGIIGFILLVGLLRGWEWLEMFQIGVSLAVAAIPEGLPIIVTVTLALGVLRMSRLRAIVRRLPSVETLGSVNVVCSDKTGTLTTNHMTATKIWHFGEPIPASVIRKQDIDDLDKATQTVLRIGNVVNHGRLLSGDAGSTSAASIMSSTMGDDPAQAKSRWIGQPTDVALLDLLDNFEELDVRNQPRYKNRVFETPFSSERKWMGVVIGGTEPGSQDMAYIKGALEQVLLKCDTYVTGDGQKIVLDESRKKEAMQAAENMAQEGLRVLGFASGAVNPKNTASAIQSRSGRSTPSTKQNGTASPNPSTPNLTKETELYTGLTFAGLVGMNDPPRKDVDKSIRKLITGGVRVIMITGDSEQTAVAIGKQLGMPISSNSSNSVLRGDQVEQMTDAELTQAVATTTVFARTSPEHKLKIVRAFQSRGDVVAMTGDGVNDAPALKKADIGISMGKTGTDVAKEAADMILTDDDFSTILSAIEEGKGIFYNIQNFLTFQLSTSAAALSLVLASTICGFKNPLNAMQILWINILMDGPPAQSLGVEPVDPAIMSRPPRSKNARVITTALIKRVLQSATIITLGTLATYVHEMSDGGIVSRRDTTMTFTCFVLFDMFNALSCRSEAKSILRGEVGLLDNRMFNFAVAGSLLGQAAVVYVPFLQQIFQTEALGLQDWIGLIMVTSVVFWVEEIRKWLTKRKTSGLGRGYSGNV